MVLSHSFAEGNGHPYPSEMDLLDVGGASPSSSTSAAGSARAGAVATPPPSSPSSSAPSPSPAAPAPSSPPTPAPSLDIRLFLNWRRHRPLPPVRAQSPRVPPEWAGQPAGQMRGQLPFSVCRPLRRHVRRRHACAALLRLQHGRQPRRVAAHMPRVLRAHAREGPLGQNPRARGVCCTGARALIGAGACT